MANFIESIFGQAPDYSSAFSPEQMDQLKQNAMLQGGIGSLVTLLGMSGPQTRPVGTGQALGAALGAGFGGYQSSFDNTLKQMLTAQQLSEYVKKQKESQQLKDLYRSAITPQYETLPGKQTAIPSEIGPLVEETPATQRIAGYNFDINKIAPALASIGKFDELKNLQEVQGMFGGSAMKVGDVAGPVKEAIQVLGIKDDKGRLKNPDQFTQEDLTRVDTYINRKTLASAPKMQVNASDPSAIAKAQADNVKDYNALIKGSREVANRYSAMVEAHKDKANPATDSTLVYGLAKIYDPAGAVQQGDLKTIVGNKSIPQTVVAAAQSLSRGGTLTEKQRDDLMSTAHNIVTQQKKNIQTDVDTYKSFSKAFNADPDQIKNPFDNLPKPEYIYTTVGNRQIKANLANDGNYYIQQGDKYYKVSE